MRDFKINMAFVAVFALLLTSCSKENEIPDSDAASISFATILNDFANEKSALKQALEDVPECSDEAPAFVEVVLTGPENVGSMANPLMVSVNPNPGNHDGDPEAEYFTNESAALQLQPGTYTLEFFAVYDGDPADPGSNLLWIAPAEDGNFGGLVDNPLPMEIALGAGVKKYVDVGVVCFDDRLVNEYGYLFFDIEDTEAIEFCVFGNFCPPGGRHFPAAYSIDVWLWENDAMGALLHEDLTATVVLDENGDFTASPVCMMLPDTGGLDEYYAEITLLDSDAYGDITERVIRSGVFNDAEVRSFFDGDNNLDYYHFREGCDGDDGPPILEDPDDDAVMYKACLTEINDSNVVAFAYLELEGNTLKTHLFGFNLEAEKVHAQHIHGLDDPNANATCPPETASGDDDIITLVEGLPFYGGVKIALTDEGGVYPTANMKGMTSYSRTFTLGSGGTISAGDLGPLENRAVVMHGLTFGEEYVGSLPVACAEIMRVNQ